MANETFYKAISGNPYREGDAVALKGQVHAATGDSNIAILRENSDVHLGANSSLASWGKRFLYVDQIGISDSTDDTTSASPNNPAIVTYAADPQGFRHFITGLSWSYNQTPVGGSGHIQIEDGLGSLIFSNSITTAGFGTVYFPDGKKGSPATAMIITLGAGGSGTTCELSVLGHRLA